MASPPETIYSFIFTKVTEVKLKPRLSIIYQVTSGISNEKKSINH